MEVDELIIYLQELSKQGKGKYTIKANNVSYNESGKDYYIEEEEILNTSMIIEKDELKEIIIGEYNEYYSY